MLRRSLRRIAESRQVQHSLGTMNLSYPLDSIKLSILDPSFDDRSPAVRPEETPKTHKEVVASYREKLQKQQAIVDQCNRQWSKFAYARGGVLILFLIVLFLAFNGAWEPSRVPYFVAGLVFAVFTVVAWKVEKLESSLRRARLIAKMHRESIARCSRDWRGD